MDSSNSQIHQIQEMDSQTLESMLICTMPQQEKKPKPSEQTLPCPRCKSINTKFCYYNNYSLSQPRYFCKSCRRYWTKGGTLRNVPVGGGCRKTKRFSSKRIQDQPITMNPSPIISPCLTPPLQSYDSNDLTLAFAMLQKDNHGRMGLYDFSNSGNQNMSHHGNSSFNGVFFNETQSGLNNVYYGSGNSQECGFKDSRIAARVKQEMRVNERESENWGFPWSGDSNNVGEVDFGRSMSWNGLGISNWHGLLNSPLM